MKISHSSSEVPQAPKEYTAAEMVKKPGVYKAIGSNSRFVVAGNPQEFQSVLYISGSMIERFDVSGWNNTKFIEAKEVLTLTFDNKD